VCVVGRMRDLILQLSKSSIYSTKPRLAEIAAKTAELTSSPNLSPAQKQAACDSYFSEHDQLTTEALEIFKKITKNPQ
ncbi:hypothetical protein QY003_27025, partial [Klebsiella pneumoniae]|nr:hypothetical protein [Klebsiella pneumoniae]